MLELAGVCLSANNIESAAGFDHEFRAGEIAVVLGANQSGKTDLCRLIAGLDANARGRVVLDGVDQQSLSPGQRSVGMVYQAFVNYPNLTVAQNIASPLRAARVASNAIEQRVATLAGTLQISDLLSRFPHELSGGQQQRVAIARALAKDARVLLLDEPLVNLDFKLREALETELRELLRASDTVVVYTSSDPRDAFTLGDQVLLLQNGQKLQSGVPMEVYAKPASLAAMELLTEPAVNRFERGDASCAVRPEHVRLEAHDDPDNRLQFEMRVTGCETSGDESFVHGTVDAHEWVVRQTGMVQIAAGTSIDVFVAPRDVARF